MTVNHQESTTKTVTRKWITGFQPKYKKNKFNCPLVKIHNETCLLFSEYILASLHITPSSHNLTPALKTHCRQMHLCLGIQETIYLLFHYASLHSGKDK